jgi:hypothetical protein
LLEVGGAAGSEADSSGGATLSDGSDRDTGATCDLFSDDKNGSVVEAVAGDEAAVNGGNK